MRHNGTATSAEQILSMLGEMLSGPLAFLLLSLLIIASIFSSDMSTWEIEFGVSA